MLASLPLVVVLAASGSPLQVVKAGHDEVQKILKADGPTVEKLAAQADQYIDFAELAKRALAEQWGKLNKKQQDEFTATMKGLLRASYAQKLLADKNSQEQSFGEEKITGNEATVASTIVAKGEKFPIEYKLYRATAAGVWKIYDVITDDVSLVATYNDQFHSVLAKKGYDGLLQTLKNRKAQLESAPEEQAAAKP